MVHMRRPRREPQDFDLEPLSNDRLNFWLVATRVCSERELEIIASRTADTDWRTIGLQQGISERHARRLWNDAIERIAGRAAPHHSRKENA